MKVSATRAFVLDSSTVGELRAAVAAMIGVPDDAPVTVTVPLEIRFGQTGSRIAALHVADGVK